MESAPTHRLSRLTREALVAALLIAAIAGANFRFIAQDDHDYAVIDANHYTERALAIAHALRDGLDWSDFRTDPHIYSPLNWILGGLFAFFTEPVPKTLRYFSAMYLPFALAYLYLFARVFFGPGGALLAIFLGGTQSLVLHYSRYFLQDTPLYLALAGSLYHLARSRWLSHPFHTLAALAFIGFGAAMKPQFAVMVAAPFALVGGMGWVTGAHRGRRLWLTLVWQAALLIALGWMAWRLRPDLFEMLPRADTAIRMTTYSYSIAVPYNDSGGNLARTMIYWLLGLIYIMRHLALPLAVLFLMGIVAGWVRLARRRLATVFLAIPLVFLSTNILIVWSGAHEEFKRYFAPPLLLYGIPVVAVAEIFVRRRRQRCALAALGALAIVGWAGPRLLPYSFDSQPRAFFSQWRMEGRVTRDYPVFIAKAWDEPVARPIRDPSATRVMETLKSVRLAPQDLGRRLQVATVCSNWPVDNSSYQFERMSDERIEFLWARSLQDILKADFLLVIWPSVSGLHGPDYRAVVAGLRSAPLRERLGFEEIESLGLPSGQILRLYLHHRPRSDPEALERASAWLETLLAPGTQRPLATEIAEAFNAMGHTQAAAAFLRLISGGPLPDEYRTIMGPNAQRLHAWSAVLARPPGDEGRAEAVQDALLAGTPSGPGMILASATACFDDGDKARSAVLFRANMERYPNHTETWMMALELVPNGLPINEKLAQMGERLARNYHQTYQIEHYANVADSLRLALQTSALGSLPDLMEIHLERMRLLERDQPNTLPTLLFQAAAMDLENSASAEFAGLLRRAIAVNASELVDYELQHALGMCLLRQGETGKALRTLRKGGWPGIESLLIYSRARRHQEHWRRELRRAARVIFPYRMEGSDAVRREIVCGLAGASPDLARQAFATMNQSSMEEELPFFSQLATVADDAGLDSLQSALQEARVSFYSSDRADVYLALLEQERLRRAGKEDLVPSPAWASVERRKFFYQLQAARRAAKSPLPVRETAPAARAATGRALHWRPAEPFPVKRFESAINWLAQLEFDRPTTETVYLRLTLEAPEGRGLQRRVRLDGALGEQQMPMLTWAPLLTGVSLPYALEMLHTPQTALRGVSVMGLFASGPPDGYAPPVSIGDPAALVDDIPLAYDDSPIHVLDLQIGLISESEPALLEERNTEPIQQTAP